MMKNLINGLLFSFFTIVTAGQSEKFTFEETYPASRELRVTTSNSDFIVDSYEGTNIIIRYRVYNNGKLIQSSKKEILKLLKEKKEIKKIQDENELRIDIVNINPEKESFQNAYEALVIHFTCLIPKNINLEIKTNDGDIFISNISSNVDLETNDGDISLKSMGGKVQAETNDGDIFIGDSGDISHLDVISNEGDIMIKNLKNFGITLSAKATSFSLPDSFSVEKDGNRINGKINKGGNQYKLNTLEGKITISE